MINTQSVIVTIFSNNIVIMFMHDHYASVILSRCIMLMNNLMGDEIKKNNKQYH